MAETPSRRILIGRAYQQITTPISRVCQRIELVDHQVLESSVPQCVALFHRIVPADHALPARRGAKLDPLEFDGQRVRIVHFRDESVRADLGVISLGNAKRVYPLDGNPCTFKKLRGICVRSRHVRRESMPLVEPVCLPKFADDRVP